MIIRPATEGDAAGIRAVSAASLPLEPDAADLAGVVAQAPGARVALVAEDAGQVTGIVHGGTGIRDATPRRGYVDLLAVTPACRGRATGSALLSAAEDQLRAAGAEEFWIGGNAPVFAWPGVDPRYTPMTCLAERAGYRFSREVVNMIVDLRAVRLDSAADESRLATACVTARRAEPGETGRLVSWLREGPWGDSTWPLEAERVMAADPPGCHVAVRDGQYLGFACHGVNRQGWFGPTGTLPGAQGRGIGTALLRRCLADIAAARQASAQIAWVGPVRFYARAVRARIDRMFWIYKKAG